MTDVSHRTSTVRRTVGSRTLEAGEARVLTASQVYDTDVEDLWEALTTPERIARWFLPVSGELREGGRYQLEGNAGGTVERCERPHRFSATWEYGPEVTWIEVRLTPTDDGRTQMALEHAAHVDDERWLRYGPGAVGVGWDLALMGLGAPPASGEPVDPAAAEAWSVSDEGKAFITASSEAWAAASAEAGTDPDEACAGGPSDHRLLHRCRRSRPDQHGRPGPRRPNPTRCDPAPQPTAP